MRTRLQVMILTALGAALAGCAVPPSGGVPASAPAEVGRLQQEQQALARQLERVQDNLVLIEARVQDQQKVLEDLRAALIAQKGTPGGEMTAALESRPAPSAPPEPAAGRGLSPTEIYLQAFSDYASGRYPQAVLGFESFLRLHTANAYAGNAQYWLGECFFAQQQYGRAAEAFQKTFDNYPQGSKTPDALLRLAETQLQLNQPDRAKATMKLLRDRYPNSTAARRAQGE